MDNVVLTTILSADQFFFNRAVRISFGAAQRLDGHITLRPFLPGKQQL